MLEERMGVWPSAVPTPSLSSGEGDLVSVSIDVAARDLEPLLEALARVDFPINPQIYHDAEMIYRYGDGSEKTESTTLVEFPAYAGRLNEVRDALAAYGFDPGSVSVTGMWEQIHAQSVSEPAPPGAGYVSRQRSKPHYQP
jgi:hypothetical protein